MADREYHFLIRLWDGPQIFHVQITAKNRSEALRQVRSISNLVECRSISSEELEGLLKADSGAKRC